MTTILIVRLIFQSLATEPLLNGNATTKDVKSFKAKIRALNSQLTGQTRVLIQDKTETDLLLTTQITQPVTIPSSGNDLYEDLLELLTSLEEDCFRLIDGNRGQDIKASYNQILAAFRAKEEELLISLGINGSTV